MRLKDYEMHTRSNILTTRYKGDKLFVYKLTALIKIIYKFIRFRNESREIFHTI